MPELLPARMGTSRWEAPGESFWVTTESTDGEQATIRVFAKTHSVGFRLVVLTNRARELSRTGIACSQGAGHATIDLTAEELRLLATALHELAQQATSQGA